MAQGTAGTLYIADRGVVEKFKNFKNIPAPLRSAIEADNRLLVSSVDITDILRAVPRAMNVEKLVGVGGGTALDFAKCLRTVAGDAALANYLARTKRSDVLFLKDNASPWRLELYATTLGTGAEASTSCSVRNSHGSLLLLKSTQFIPDTGERLLSLTDHLSRQAVVEACVEVLFRTIGTLPECAPSSRDEDNIAIAAEVLDLIHATESRVLDRTEKERLCDIGARTHEPMFVDAPSPFVGKAWYLGRELQQLSQLSKVQALVHSWLKLHEFYAEGPWVPENARAIELVTRALYSSSLVSVARAPIAMLLYLAERLGVSRFSLREDARTVYERAIRENWVELRQVFEPAASRSIAMRT